MSLSAFALVWFFVRPGGFRNWYPLLESKPTLIIPCDEVTIRAKLNLLKWELFHGRRYWFHLDTAFWTEHANSFDVIQSSP